MEEASGFDLERYMARLGLDRAPSVSPEGLAAIQRAQMRAIPFENLDVMLGRPIRLEPGALMSKLVDQPRGGYCFELNCLLHSALSACGFEARPLLARVLVGRPAEEPGPKTHCLLLTELGGRAWVADAGFGLGLPHEPMPLEEGTEHEQLDARLRFRRDEDLGWVLQRAAGEAWSDLYAFHLERVYPADIVAANHFTSTFPKSPFLRVAFLSRALEDGARLSVLGTEGATYRRSGATPEEIPSGAARIDWLRERFGIELDVDPEALPPWPSLG